MTYLIAYIVAGIVFGAMDALWLGWAGPHLYRPALGELLAPTFRVAPAMTFYALYLGGIVWFAVRPGLAAGLASAALNGAILGALCYMTFDLTAQAVMARWPLHVTLADIAWGTIATMVAAVAGTSAAARFTG